MIGPVESLSFELEIKHTLHCENRPRTTEHIDLTLELMDQNKKEEYVLMEVIVEVIPKPHRKYRVLWDEFHLHRDETNKRTYEDSRDMLYHKYIKVFLII